MWMNVVDYALHDILHNTADVWVLSRWIKHTNNPLSLIERRIASHNGKDITTSL